MCIDSKTNKNKLKKREKTTKRSKGRNYKTYKKVVRQRNGANYGESLTTNENISL